MLKTKQDKNTKEKLIKVALDLFYQRGYDKTSINEIVGVAKVSKGAFYHYFDSKEKILEEVVKSHTQKIVKLGEEVLNDKSLNAVDKFNQYLRVIKQYKSSNIKQLIELDNFINKEDNLKFRDRHTKMLFEMVRKPIADIIRQGIKEGVFTVSSPEDVALIILTIISSLKDEIMKLFVSLKKNPENIKLIEKKLKFVEEMISRILGMKNDKIVLMDGSIGNIVKAYKKSQKLV